MDFTLVEVSGGCSPVGVRRLLIAVAFLVAEHMLSGKWASVAVALEYRLSSCGTQD